MLTSNIQTTNADKGLQIYPNPANHYITIKNHDNNSDNSVRIVDIKGTVVWESFYNGGAIDISKLPNGVYFIQLNEYMGKFVKSEMQ